MPALDPDCARRRERGTGGWKTCPDFSLLSHFVSVYFSPELRGVPKITQEWRRKASDKKEKRKRREKKNRRRELQQALSQKEKSGSITLALKVKERKGGEEAVEETHSFALACPCSSEGGGTVERSKALSFLPPYCFSQVGQHSSNMQWKRKKKEGKEERNEISHLVFTISSCSDCR